VSLSGMKIRSVAYLARNQQLDGHLVLPDGRRIALHVLVVWSTPPDPAGFVLAEAGLEILNVPAEYAAALVDIFAQEAE